MQFPNIGKQGNILAILIPGIFVLFNFCLGFYVFFDFSTIFKNIDLSNLFKDSNAFIFLFFILIVCFGYLIGVVLRLFRSEIPDNISAWYLRTFHHKFRKSKPLFAKEKFPYISYMEILCKKNLPEETLDFYNIFWKPRKDVLQNRQFFNHCKTIIIAIDQNLASECYSAESLNRYISGMFFGLVISFFVLLGALLELYLFSFIFSYFFLTLIIVYLSAIFFIIKYYRFMRIKEVETVFAATFSSSRCKEWPYNGGRSEK